jgi:hypothetical protein
VSTFRNRTKEQQKYIAANTSSTESAAQTQEDQYMTTRRLQTHEEFMREFVGELKREVKSSLAAMSGSDQKLLAQRRAAYASVFFVLKKTAEKHDIQLVDLGLVDYEVPDPQADA